MLWHGSKQDGILGWMISIFLRMLESIYLYSEVELQTYILVPMIEEHLDMSCITYSVVRQYTKKNTRGIFGFVG